MKIARLALAKNCIGGGVSVLAGRVRGRALLFGLLALVIAPLMSMCGGTVAHASLPLMGLTIETKPDGSYNDNISVQAPAGGTTVDTRTLNIWTTAYKGYVVTVNINSEIKTNALTSDAGTINPVAGTLSAPVALSSNTWGIAVPGMPGFNQLSDYTTTNASAKYAAVPLSGSTGNTIINKDSASISSGDEQPVVFGVNTAQSTKPGQYKTTVTYTSTANIPPEPTVSSISPTSFQLSSPGSSAKITINGTNLDSVDSVFVDLNGNEWSDNNENCLKVTAVSETQVTCNVQTPSQIIQPGSYDLYVETQGGQVVLKKGITFTTSATKDGSVCNSTSTASTCKVDIDEGMIPIKYAGDTTAPKWTVVTDSERSTTNDWYDYSSEAKKWANAVTVTPASAAKYKAAMKGTDTGVEVKEDEVLGYYVYIPRYAYEVQRRDYTNKAVSAVLSVRYENTSIAKKTPKQCNKSEANVYYPTDCGVSRDYNTANQPGKANETTWATHPAFTFGGKELNGIWVAKYEITGTSSAPTSKPNAKSISSQSVGAYYDIANSIGVKDNDVTDKASSVTVSQNSQHLSTYTSHMIKPTEWGAVAYLSATKYGAGLNMVQANNTAGTTGSGPDGNAYNTIDGQTASTTGNVYGVYDMAGSLWEYVMGNYATTDNVINQGTYNSSDNSGGTGGTTQKLTSFATTKVPAKLVNFYNQSIFTKNDNVGNYTQCTWDTCGGQALHETYAPQTEYKYDGAWGGAYSYMPIANEPWSMRGGLAGYGSYTGIFASYSSDGAPGPGSRAVLVGASNN